MSSELTVEFAWAILEYDRDTGVFRWRFRRGNVNAGDIAGRLDRDGYREIRINGRVLRAHRLAWFMTFGEWPRQHIDHINGLRDDNRIANLRDVSRTANIQNVTRGHRDSKSGLLGAHWRSADGVWTSSIGVNGKKHALGTFATEVAAHNAYMSAKAAMHEGYVADDRP